MIKNMDTFVNRSLLEFSFLSCIDIELGVSFIAVGTLFKGEVYSCSIGSLI